MFIVHVVRQFHPGVGGLENGVLDLVLAQAAAGDRVRVVTLDRLFHADKPQKLAAIETLNGVEIVRIPYFGSKRYPIGLSVLRHITDADLVHVHAIDFFFDYLAWTKPIHGRTLVVSTHGGFFHTPYAARFKRVWFATVTRLSIKFYAAVIAISTSDYEAFNSIRAKGMVFVENGANVDKFYDASARDFKKSILSLGRFASNKRIDLLVGFAQALRQHDPDWRLTIAGRPGDLQAPHVKALVEDAGLQDMIEVIPSPTDEVVKSLMSNNSFVACSSDYEGFGMAAVEGMSAGLFPLLSGIPPFRRLVARTGIGMIVDFSHPAIAVRRLLKNLTKVAFDYAEQRAACMRAVIPYDWRNVRAKFSAVYDAALGKTVRTILDVPVQVRCFDAAVALIDAHFEKGEPVAVAFANAHTLNLAAATPNLQAAFQSSIVLNDGIGVNIASRLLYGSPFPEDLKETDFSPKYLRHTKHRYRIFLLGATPGTAERAASRLNALCPRHKIVGCHHGYFDAARVPEITDLIRCSGSNLLLVSMHNPKQGLFLHEHLAETGCGVGIGVGSLFDSLADNAPLATPRAQKHRVEWVGLIQEECRLARHYLVDNPLFLMRILRQWWSGARVRQAGPDGSKQATFPVKTAPADRKGVARKALSV